MKIPKIMAACAFLLMQNIAMGSMVTLSQEAVGPFSQKAVGPFSQEAIGLLENDAQGLRKLALEPLGEDYRNALAEVANGLRNELENTMYTGRFHKNITPDSFEYAESLVGSVYSNAEELLEKGTAQDFSDHVLLHPFCLENDKWAEELFYKAIMAHEKGFSHIPDGFSKIEFLLNYRHWKNAGHKREVKHNIARWALRNECLRLISIFISDASDIDYEAKDGLTILSYASSISEISPGLFEYLQGRSFDLSC